LCITPIHFILYAVSPFGAISVTTTTMIIITIIIIIIMVAVSGTFVRIPHEDENVAVPACVLVHSLIAPPLLPRFEMSDVCSYCG